jgi:hypothetical protein
MKRSLNLAPAAAVVRVTIALRSGRVLRVTRTYRTCAR